MIENVEINFPEEYKAEDVVHPTTHNVGGSTYSVTFGTDPDASGSDIIFEAMQQVDDYEALQLEEDLFS